MSDKHLLRQYKALAKDLQEARKAAGGTLSEAAEEEYLSPMDTLWYQMSEKARRAVSQLNSHAQAPKPT